MTSRRVVLASRNAKKLAELRRILDTLLPGNAVLGLDDVTPYPEPAETEATFEGNALLKARACVKATGLPSLADDSGLVRRRPQRHARRAVRPVERGRQG